MYETGELLLYACHGVCRFLGTEERVNHQKRVSYCILEPLEQAGMKFYVPMANATAMGKIRRLLSREELDSLLHDGRLCGDSWIADENQRKQAYRSMISSGDRTALISMVHALYQHKESQRQLGRRLHTCDDQFLHDAQKMLDTEFSVVLDIPQEQVGSYVRSAMGI